MTPLATTPRHRATTLRKMCATPYIGPRLYARVTPGTRAHTPQNPHNFGKSGVPPPLAHADTRAHTPRRCSSSATPGAKTSPHIRGAAPSRMWRAAHGAAERGGAPPARRCGAGGHPNPCTVGARWRYGCRVRARAISARSRCCSSRCVVMPATGPAPPGMWRFVGGRARVRVSPVCPRAGGGCRLRRSHGYGDGSAYFSPKWRHRDGRGGHDRPAFGHAERCDGPAIPDVARDRSGAGGGGPAGRAMLRAGGVGPPDVTEREER